MSDIVVTVLLVLILTNVFLIQMNVTVTPTVPILTVASNVLVPLVIKTPMPTLKCQDVNVNLS